MRIAGYVRESADPAADRPAFAQQEELRRYAAEHGHDLVAVCRDAREPGHALGRAGYRSLLGVIASGGLDAVLLPGIETLSSDQIVQEILLWDLRARRVRVLSTRAEDDAVLGSGDPGPARMMIRDVLARVTQHLASTAAPPAGPGSNSGRAGAGNGPDVVIHLTPPDAVAEADRR